MGRAGARGRGKSRPSREPAIGIKKTNFCSRIAPVNWIYALIAFRRDGAMLLVLTLFWRWAVPGLRGCLNIFPFFPGLAYLIPGRLNSCLALLRQLARKGLI
jgi:hypothetical protein